MSGKAPPRAPRALLNSFPGGAASSSSAATSTSTSRIGATPPTGPRSLLSGVNGHHGLAGGRGVGRGKPYVNGHGTTPAGPATTSLPVGPRSSLKGKQLEAQPSHASTSVTPDPSLSSPTATNQRGLPYADVPQTNGAGPSKLNGEAVGLTTNRLQPVSFRLRPPPPQPTTEPPPPPPPTIEPPPPPPPSSTPPPPPPPPDSVPPPPPSSEPPPAPPPPSSEPPPAEPPPPPTSPAPKPPSPPPPPPTSEPPPPPPSAVPPRLPPTAPRNHVPYPLAESTSRPLPAGSREHATPSVPPPAQSPPPPPPAEPKLYSLPPPPPWPPARSEFPQGKDYKVLFDHVIDKDRDGQIRLLAEKLREMGMDVGEEARVKGKGKGRELIIRYEGETIEGEHPAVLRDPRKETKVKRKETMRPVRAEVHPIKYEYDANSTGPPLPTAVLVLNLSPLTPNAHIRRCFAVHGVITSFEPQVDKTTGAALGVVYIRYSTHAEARKCVEKEHGKRLTALNGITGGAEEMTVVLDGEGKKLHAILKELDVRRRRALEEKRRKEREAKTKEGNSARGTPSATSAHTPVGPNHSSRPPAPWQKTGIMRPAPASAKLPPKPVITPVDIPDSSTTHLNGVPSGPKGAPPAQVRKVVPPTFRARLSSVSKFAPAAQPLSLRPPLPASESSSSTPVRPWTRRSRDARVRDWRSRSPSRSPSPVMRRPGQSSRNAYQKDHDGVLEELAKNGFEHVTLDGHGGQLGYVVREEDVRQFFHGFRVDKILRDRLGWYVTFETSDSARRAAMVLNHGTRTLASRTVNVTVHPAPAPPSAPSRKRWTDSDLVDEATSLVTKELRALLEKDILDKVVSAGVQKLVLAERESRAAKLPDPDQDAKQWGAGLRGLSFKKQRKRPREEELKRPVSTSAPAAPEPPEWHADPVVEEALLERPKKRQKKPVPKVVVNEDIESEDEEVHEAVTAPATKAVLNQDIESEDEDLSLPMTPVLSDVARKRSTSEVTDIEEPTKKRLKTQGLHDMASIITPAPFTKKTKKASKKATKKEQGPIVQEVLHEVLPDDFDFDVPEVAQVRVTSPPQYDSSVSPPASPTWKKPPLRTQDLALPDPFAEGLCEDDEDLYFVKLALARDRGIDESELDPSPMPAPEPDAPPPFRVHVTGSARTEGYYKISHAEKSAYVAQYASRGTVNEAEPEKEQPPQQNVTSSRSNRANARRRAAGLEEINQVQRAMALSKGESAATELIKFNQLQTRKKHLRFARSPIHDWGLYAMEKISRGEMVIEYVGEVIRAQVADKREKAYERQGIGSSYLFRIDEDLVVDATKKGNLGRLINHSCEPNCTARIIMINGEKKIVIYAKQDIELGSEITYDYHFPIEQDKIPCLCGSAKCRGFLN